MNRLLRDIYMKITIIISTRLFILFPNLITKESYNWWVTRRVWGFRYQISKTKYLKISKAKYLKISQNVGRTYREASGEHRGTVQNAVKLSGYALSVDPDMSDRGNWTALFSHSDMSARCETSGEGGTSPDQNSGCDTSGWRVAAARCNGGGIRV